MLVLVCRNTKASSSFSAQSYGLLPQNAIHSICNQRRKPTSLQFLTYIPRFSSTPWLISSWLPILASRLAHSQLPKFCVSTINLGHSACSILSTCKIDEEIVVIAWFLRLGWMRCNKLRDLRDLEAIKELSHLDFDLRSWLDAW